MSESKKPDMLNDLSASITDVKFSTTGRLILARNALTVKIWDVAYEKEPLAVYDVDDSLFLKAISIYESGSLFDRFEVLITRNDSFVLTGTYGDSVKIFGMPNTSELDVDGSIYEISSDYGSTSEYSSFDRKIMHYDCHPFEDIIAMGVNDQIMTYRYVD